MVLTVILTSSPPPPPPPQKWVNITYCTVHCTSVRADILGTSSAIKKTLETDTKSFLQYHHFVTLCKQKNVYVFVKCKYNTNYTKLETPVPIRSLKCSLSHG